jgi:V-type H+-transporting ATPase subunit A
MVFKDPSKLSLSNQDLSLSLKGIFFYCRADVLPLNFDKTWLFEPNKSLRVGQLVTGGDILGSCFENSLFDEHRILTPPRVKGTLTYLAVEGNYSIEETIATVEFDGKVQKVSMSHWWPVRQTRPTAEKLAGNVPLLTGQRVLDSLFPSVLGGTCAIPGAFGCGKTCISQALSKYSNSEVLLFI